MRALAGAAALLLAAAGTALAADIMPADERAVVERLLDAVKKSDLTFIRKDKTYDAKAAAFYLRLRWKNNEEKVRSVRDFIDLVSVGGERGEITYMVGFPDGSQRKARDVLEEAVAAMRTRK